MRQIVIRMERRYNENYYIKKPSIYGEYRNHYKRSINKNKSVIIPIRDLKTAAKSRVRHGRQRGGLWNANDELSQINFFKNILTNYIVIATKYDINTIFIDFDKMINDKKYLFFKLEHILNEKNIDLDTFSRVYDEFH